MQRRPLVVVNVEKSNPDQHEDTPEQGIEHVFQRRIVPLRTSTPELDEEVARDEHQLPKHEKEDQVDGDKDTHRRRFKRQEGHHVQLDLVPDGVPRIDDDENREESRQSDKQDADAIDRQVIAESEGWDPSYVLGELHRGRVRNEVKQDEEGHGELNQYESQRPGTDKVLIVEQPQHGSPGNRQKENARENGES